jgi:hypothetical protein
LDQIPQSGRTRFADGTPRKGRVVPTQYGNSTQVVDVELGIWKNHNFGLDRCGIPNSGST